MVTKNNIHTYRMCAPALFSRVCWRQTRRRSTLRYTRMSRRATQIGGRRRGKTTDCNRDRRGTPVKTNANRLDKMSSAERHFQDSQRQTGRNKIFNQPLADVSDASRRDEDWLFFVRRAEKTTNTPCRAGRIKYNRPKMIEVVGNDYLLKGRIRAILRFTHLIRCFCMSCKWPLACVN